MSRATILVVDDEPNQRALFKQMLNRGGYTVIGAESCDDAYVKLREHSIDLALVDIVMPGKSGLECLKAIKEHYTHIGVIILTGSIPEDIALQSLDMGADDFLHKPIRREQLLTCIGNVLFNKKK